ncbi:MAG TPA: hypothetical protein VGG04_18805 [Candidatus Sulfotelmatobacter sp.]|jgi:hypothetical protein
MLMDKFATGVLFGICAVLILDTGGSVLSQRLKFRYSRLAPISLLLWGTAADMASRGAGNDLAGAIVLGGLAGLIVGFFDSTVGWWISWCIGAGRLERESITNPKIARTILTVTMLATAVGATTVFLVELVGKAIQRTT